METVSWKQPRSLVHASNSNDAVEITVKYEGVWGERRCSRFSTFTLQFLHDNCVAKEQKWSPPTTESNYTVPLPRSKHVIDVNYSFARPFPKLKLGNNTIVKLDEFRAPAPQSVGVWNEWLLLDALTNSASHVRNIVGVSVFKLNVDIHSRETQGVEGVRYTFKPLGEVGVEEIVDFKLLEDKR